MPEQAKAKVETLNEIRLSNGLKFSTKQGSYDPFMEISKEVQSGELATGKPDKQTGKPRQFLNTQSNGVTDALAIKDFAEFHIKACEASQARKLQKLAMVAGPAPAQG